MSENKYKLVIEGEGTTLKREVDERQLLQILSVVLGSGGAYSDEEPSVVPGLAGRKAAGSEVSRPQVTVGEFLSGIGPGTNYERIGAIGLYLRDHLQQENFGRDELPGWFRKAGLAVPKNLPRDLALAVRRNFIAEEPDDGERYYVTTTGEQELTAGSNRREE